MRAKRYGPRHCDDASGPMELLKALKFVSGAVAKSDYVPALQHIAIGGGYAVAFNGTISLCSPVVLDVAACPRADIFAKAIAACKEPAQLHLTKHGLIVQSGSLRVTVPCTQETFPRIFPEGQTIQLSGELLPIFRILEPLVSTDTSRQHFNGVLLRDNSAYATNNIVLVEYWHGSRLPVMNLPLVTICEILRIGEEPSHAQVCDRSATFHYSDGRWLRTILYPTAWPQSLTELLQHTDAAPLPKGFFEALKQIAPFTIDTVFMHSNTLSTCATLNEGGAQITVEGLSAGPRFSMSQLRSLENVATAINFADYPQPCRFIGESTRGVIMGKI